MEVISLIQIIKTVSPGVFITMIVWITVSKLITLPRRRLERDLQIQDEALKRREQIEELSELALFLQKNKLNYARQGFIENWVQVELHATKSSPFYAKHSWEPILHRRKKNRIASLSEYLSNTLATDPSNLETDPFKGKALMEKQHS